MKRTDRHQRIGQIDQGVAVRKLTVTVVIVDKATLDSAGVHAEDDQRALLGVDRMFTPLASTAPASVKIGCDVVFEIQAHAGRTAKGIARGTVHRGSRQVSVSQRAQILELVNADGVVVVMVCPCDVKRYVFYLCGTQDQIHAVITTTKVNVNVLRPPRRVRCCLNVHRRCTR